MRPMVSVSPSVLAELVYRALENERALDFRYRDLYLNAEKEDLRIPNYKPMVQVSLKRRLGLLYRPFIWLAVFLAPLLNLLNLLTAFVRALWPIQNAKDAVYIFPTSATNRDLIMQAMAQAPGRPDPKGPVIQVTAAFIARSLGVGGVGTCAFALVLLYARIFRMAGRRIDLSLHARDAVFLLLLTAFALRNKDKEFWSDCHYQRWGFLLSSASANYHAVQHGFVDDGISFPFAFGQMQCLAVRHPRFVPQFEHYYAVGRHYAFSPTVRFDTVGSGDILFLASSAPHIDEEIAFLRRLKGGANMPIAVKLHPAHKYDERKAELLALADLTCGPMERPAARYFVSHSSFMEYEYEAAGTLTCSIARCGGSEAAAQWILKRLDRRHLAQTD